MYRLDKIDLQLVHVVPAIERLGAAAGVDPGAMQPRPLLLQRMRSHRRQSACALNDM